MMVRPKPTLHPSVPHTDRARAIWFPQAARCISCTVGMVFVTRWNFYRVMAEARTRLYTVWTVVHTVAAMAQRVDEAQASIRTGRKHQSCSDMAQGNEG